MSILLFNEMIHTTQTPIIYFKPQVSKVFLSFLNFVPSQTKLHHIKWDRRSNKYGRSSMIIEILKTRMLTKCLNQTW